MSRRTSRSMRANVLLLPNGMEPNVLLLPNASGFGGFGGLEMTSALLRGSEDDRVRNIVDNNVRETKRLLREYKRARNSISVKKQVGAAKFLANAMMTYGIIWGVYQITIDIASLKSLSSYILPKLNSVWAEIDKAMETENWFEERDVP